MYSPVTCVSKSRARRLAGPCRPLRDNGRMGNKAECPACKAWTSGVRDAMDGVLGSCPHCGLAGEVIGGVYAAREALANADLIAKYEAVLVRAGKAEAETRKLRKRLDVVQAAMDGWPGDQDALNAEDWDTR